MDLIQLLDLVANNYVAILQVFGITGTAVSTTASVISKYLPDTIKKDTTILGIRVGKIRGFYNPFMYLVNKIGFNTGKASNHPKAQ